jgi:hypothetical protein
MIALLPVKKVTFDTPSEPRNPVKTAVASGASMSTSANELRQPMERQCLHRRKHRASLWSVDVLIGESIAPASGASMSSSAKASRQPTERRCPHRRKHRARLRSVDVHIGERVAPAYGASMSSSAKEPRQPMERRCPHRRKNRASLWSVDAPIGENVAPAYGASISTSAKASRQTMERRCPHRRKGAVVRNIHVKGNENYPRTGVTVIQRGDEEKRERFDDSPRGCAPQDQVPTPERGLR